MSDFDFIPNPGRGIASARMQGEARRVILFVARAGAIPASLVHALEREFPWVVVAQVEEVEAAFGSFEHPVALLLIDGPLIAAAATAGAVLGRSHPLALIAAIEHDGRAGPCASPNYELDFIRGVLPMNLRLDLWLSVIQLMLRGGEYFPAAFLRPPAGQGRGAAPAPQGRIASGAPSAAQMPDLTKRETQVLEMVSRGAQNKTIAAAFDLSEHTVKIHLHNIISKLGAHNRTEAAARFRDHFSRHAPAQSDAEASPDFRA